MYIIEYINSLDTDKQAEAAGRWVCEELEAIRDLIIGGDMDISDAISSCFEDLAGTSYKLEEAESYVYHNSKVVLDYEHKHGINL